MRRYREAAERNIKYALAHGNAALLENTLQDALNKSVSYHDLPKGTGKDENKDSPWEMAYHAFVNGLSLALDDVYMVRSDEESGLGRFHGLPSEKCLGSLSRGHHRVESAKSEKDIDAEAEEALGQIDDKMYDARLKDAGVARIDKYAMVFFGKNVKVVKKENKQSFADSKTCHTDTAKRPSGRRLWRSFLVPEIEVSSL